MLDAESKVFAIKACKAEGKNAIKFSKPRLEQKTRIAMSASAILRLLRSTMRNEWDMEHRYRITGVYFPEDKAMGFDLQAADVLPIRRSIKKR